MELKKAERFLDLTKRIGINTLGELKRFLQKNDMSVDELYCFLEKTFEIFEKKGGEYNV